MDTTANLARIPRYVGQNIFNSLLVSSPNSGGLFYLSNGRAFKLDNIDTTGICLTPRGLYRGSQPLSLVYADMQGAVPQAIEIGGANPKFSDIHDVLWFDDSLWVVGTDFNCILRLDPAGNVVDERVFSGERDSRHVNCLGLWRERLCFSAFGDFEKHRGYKGNAARAGYVEDVLSGERLITGLSQPHSLASAGETLIVANSAEFSLVEYDRNGRPQRAKHLGGYTRGVCVCPDVIYAGVSRSRNAASTIPSAQVIALRRSDWEEVGRLSLPVNEIYDIVDVPGELDVLRLVLTMIDFATEAGRRRNDGERSLATRMRSMPSRIAARLRRSR